MTTYVSILRGINVSGQKKIRMEDLRALYESLGLENVRSYIQSGNVVFDAANTDAAFIRRQIERGIADRFGFDVPVLLRTETELKRTIAGNPFVRQGVDDISRLHVTFLAGPPAAAAIQGMLLPASGADECSINKDVVYLHCPNGYGKTKLSNSFFERKLKVAATTRNWKTVNRLLAMAEGAR